jgi:hypothetical protein
MRDNMRKFWITVRLSLIIFLIFVSLQVQAEEGQEAIRFMPNVNMMVEATGYSSNKADYSAKFQRLIQMDVIRYRDISLGLEFDEETILGGPEYSSDEPYNVGHRLKYLNLRYDSKKRSYSLFYQHRCVNGIDRSGAERGFDVIGLKFETKNMRYGHKNYGINFDAQKEFEFLSQFGYSVSLAKKIVERAPELDAFGKFSLRWDILRYKNYIPYFELGLHSIWGSELKWDYIIELGTRINYRYAFISPFLRYSYQSDLDRWRGLSEHFFIAGLRLETLSRQDLLSSQQKSGISPQMHMQGYYANFVGAKDFEWHGNATLDIDFYRRDNFRVFLNTNVDLISPSGAYRPRFATYKLEPGIGIDENEKSLEFIFRHTSRYDVNTSDGFTEQAGLLGLRRQTLGMKTGSKNKGIDFASPKRCEFLKKIDWEIAGGRYIYTSDYDYDWNAEFGIRWDILRHIKKIPYLEGNLNFLIGSHLDIEYYLESGIRFSDIGDITPFVRYQHKENVNYFGGYSDNYLLTGVKFEF